MPLRITAIFALAAALAMPAELTYQKPPQEILDVLNAPPPPLISVNPSRDYAILMQPLRYPPIAEVAQPMLRLAGLRIDIRTNGPHPPPYSTAYTIKRLSDASAGSLTPPRPHRLADGTIVVTFAQQVTSDIDTDSYLAVIGAADAP